ncbi:transcription factor STKL2 [Panicum hallii]|uniref:transcription factor STKL2 n=1 Tax=Panicum hallii TaxID=206008 RepID=UPI000DF4EF67|nr:transcription factor STKL2 [Panicum hallii]
MPSKRPSPHAMDEAAAAGSAARLRPSTPRSKKRSSRSKSRARSRDRRRSPNPNPSSRRDRAPEPGSAAPAPSRKSDRRPKPRYIPDSATLATAIVSSAAAAAAAASGGGGRGSAGAISKLWSEADEVALLTGAAAFKDRTGIAPRLPDMPDLFEAIRDSLAPHLDQAKMYYKLKRLKSKFQHSVPGDSSTAHEHRVRDLCAALWGAELARPAENDVVDAEEAEEEDARGGFAGGDREGAARLPMVKEVLGEYWKSNGQGLSGVSLEKGLALLGSQEASVAEGKWRRQLEADMRMQMRRHDLGKEVYGLLIDAIKGLGP